MKENNSPNIKICLGELLTRILGDGGSGYVYEK